MWTDQDEFDSKYKDKLISLVNKINKQRDLGLFDDQTSIRLKELFANLPPIFFFPFVVRIDGAAVPPQQRILAGSGATSGSAEFLVVNLKHELCELLFSDGQLINPLKDLFYSCLGIGYFDSYQVMDTIENALRIHAPK